MNKLLELISYEFDIFFAFTWRDWTTTIIPGSTWAVGAIATGQPSAASLLYRLPRLVVWLTLYIYFFNLTNQITGIDEDRVNKPDGPFRPARSPSGAPNALARAIPSPSLLAESAIWVLTAAFLCLTPQGHTGSAKNCVGMVYWADDAAQRVVARDRSPYDPRSAVYISHFPDLRDVEGDQAVGPEDADDRLWGRCCAQDYLRIDCVSCGGDIVVGGVSSLSLRSASFWCIGSWHIESCMLWAVRATTTKRTWFCQKYTYTFCYILALVLFKDAFPKSAKIVILNARRQIFRFPHS
ncbi:hypothetical protein C8J57DRAFT_1237629 [Mycena rebaudengoi]|nr:hypothetical protein C8J57DRAFT_1237629 [Mycena rebaudengoi]